MKKTIMLLITFVIVSTAFTQSGWTDLGIKVVLSNNTDKVGIGTQTPLSQLSVGGSGNGATAIFGRTNSLVAIRGVASNTGNVKNYGGYFIANGERGIGIYATAPSSRDSMTYGGYFEVDSRDGIGVYGLASGWVGCGVFGYSNHPGNTGKSYGVRGKVDSRYGWAGYFEGRGYFSDNVGIGIEDPNANLHVNGTTKFGTDSKAIRINEIIEIKGRTGGGNYSDYDYPSPNWNHKNTRVISCDIYKNNDVWRSSKTGLFANRIRIYHEESSYEDKDYRLMLMRID